MKHHSSRGPLALAALATLLSTAGTVVATAPAGGASAAPACRAGDLYVAKGRLEGAAGNRFLTLRVTNVGDGTCSMGAATKAGFRDWSGQLGAKGDLSDGGGAVTLSTGETARTTVHWTDPGPVPADDCQEASATLVTLRVPSVQHTWRVPFAAQVCTTFDYRPDSTPLA